MPSVLPAAEATRLPMISTQRVAQARRRTHPGKTKRTLTPGNFFRTVGNVLASGPVLVEALFRPKISAALREKLMLGVTSVNDCRYCKWGHTHWAMAKGVPLEEVNRILGSRSSLWRRRTRPRPRRYCLLSTTRSNLSTSG